MTSIIPSRASNKKCRADALKIREFLNDKFGHLCEFRTYLRGRRGRRAVRVRYCEDFGLVSFSSVYGFPIRGVSEEEMLEIICKTTSSRIAAFDKVIATKTLEVAKRQSYRYNNRELLYIWEKHHDSICSAVIAVILSLIEQYPTGVFHYKENGRFIFRAHGVKVRIANFCGYYYWIRRNSVSSHQVLPYFNYIVSFEKKRNIVRLILPQPIAEEIDGVLTHRSFTEWRKYLAD